MTRDAVKAKAIDGLLALAAEGGEVSLAAAAGRADLALDDLARHGLTLSCLLRGLDRRFDDAATAGVRGVDASEGARDRLFDAVMKRFEAMEPHKPALLAIRALEHGDPAARAALAGRRLRSALWLLEAAGVRVLGLKGAARAAGLAGILARVERVWRKDGPDFTQTMAALDAALRQAEEAEGRLAPLARMLRPSRA